jgi:hypothetical protein
VIDTTFYTVTWLDLHPSAAFRTVAILLDDSVHRLMLCPELLKTEIFASILFSRAFYFPEFRFNRENFNFNTFSINFIANAEFNWRGF